MGLWDFFGSLLGNVASSGLSAISTAAAQKRQYEYSQKLQNSQNLFTSWMSNTAHQREVQDMRLAGLNPILSATGGSGASTPAAGSAMASAVQPDMKLDVASAIQLHNETQLRKSQESLNDAEGSLLRSQQKGAVWDALSKQQYYDEIQPLEAEKIKAEIANQTAVSAAQVRNLDAQAYASVMNAHTDRYNYGLQEELTRGQRRFETHHPKQSEFTYGAGRWLGAVGSAILGTVGGYTARGVQGAVQSARKRPVGFRP